MGALCRAEVVKALTTGALFGLIVGTVVVALLGAVSVIMSGAPGDLDRPVHDQQYFLLASINVSLFALILGIKGFTDEFRHGLIVPTLLVTPARGHVFAAKGLTAALLGAVLAIIALGAMIAASVPLLAAKDAPFRFVNGDVLAIFGLAAAAGAWAVIGVGLGAAVRQQVGAVVAGLVWILVFENLGSGFLGEAARFLPGQAGFGLANVTQASNVLSPVLAAAVLGTYAALAWLVGLTALQRRDVAATG